MSTQAHTPGPWDCEVRSYAGVKWDGIIRSQRNRDPICSVFFAGYMAKEAAANARLIAAAPEMLAALQAVVAVADRKTVEFDKARAAIAKATGAAS